MNYPIPPDLAASATKPTLSTLTPHPTPPSSATPPLKDEGSLRLHARQFCTNYTRFSTVRRSTYSPVFLANCFRYSNAFPPPDKIDKLLEKRLSFILQLSEPPGNGPRPRPESLCYGAFCGWGLPPAPSPTPVTQHPLPSGLACTHNLPPGLSLAPGRLLRLAPSHRRSQEAEVVHTRPYNSAGALI